MGNLAPPKERTLSVSCENSGFGTGSLCTGTGSLCSNFEALAFYRQASSFWKAKVRVSLAYLLLVRHCGGDMETCT